MSDTLLTLEALERLLEMQRQVEPLIHRFGVTYAIDCGETMPPSVSLIDWKIVDGRLHAMFEDEDDDKYDIDFPVLAMTDEVERNAAVAGRVADIEIAAYNHRQAEIVRLEVERDMTLSRLNDRINEKVAALEAVKAPR